MNETVITEALVLTTLSPELRGWNGGKLEAGGGRLGVSDGGGRGGQGARAGDGAEFDRGD